MTAAAITGSFADFKLIKSRSVAQLIIEIPIEHTDAALATLGGVPQPATERPVAIARLTEEAARKPDARERYQQASEGEQAVTRAALLCEDEDFQRWMLPGENFYVVTPRYRVAHVADVLRRQIGGIESRAELATNAEALRRFLDLEARYRTEKGYGPHATR